MNERIRQLAEQARKNEPFECSYTKDQWLEKFAELIVRECSRICGSQADQRNILKHFGFPVESNVRAPGPEPHWSVTSQYTRDYNMPKKSQQSVNTSARSWQLEL